LHDEGHVSEPESTSVSELAKGQNDGEQAMVSPTHTKPNSNCGVALARADSDHDAGNTGLSVGPRNSEGVGQKE
jgi:hypothetical protein